MRRRVSSFVVCILKVENRTVAARLWVDYRPPAAYFYACSVQKQMPKTVV